MSLKRLYGLYASATVDELRAGRAWYDEARAYACELSERFDVPHEVAAGVLACLSPNSRWERNKLDALLERRYEKLRCIGNSRPEGARRRAVASRVKIKEAVKAISKKSSPVAAKV